jgi:NAD(P)-dependent dehydrogenase (short-subunit alcohol dehydrogenase family)
VQGAGHGDNMPAMLTILTGVGREGQVGEAVARAFAERGDRLALVDRTAGEVARRAESLRAAAPATSARAVTSHACDLTDPAAVSAVVREIVAAHGEAAGAFVHLAGGFGTDGPVAASDPALLDRMLAINLRTAFVATRGFLPLLRAGGGAIVYFASAAVLPGASGSGTAAYAAAKAGVLALMRAVADEERAAGVRANAVAPIAIRTGDNVRAMGDGARYVEREDVAHGALALLRGGARGDGTGGGAGVKRGMRNAGPGTRFPVHRVPGPASRIPAFPPC